MVKLSRFAESMNEIEHELREYIYAAALSFYQRTLFKKSDHLSTVAKKCEDSICSITWNNIDDNLFRIVG